MTVQPQRGSTSALGGGATRGGGTGGCASCTAGCAALGCASALAAASSKGTTFDSPMMAPRRKRERP
jgi:hypothetical protein